ncbi:hypothetical protein [Salinadaptatus halalkaliphilus]|uniref:hypothetical protein n=1 Tax=Salinadaptatus halalkaliphilus TaxID=2419781 RepID=UPI00158063AC|nr:hypothetical protein [Salinadaptatus halalkaliphilus]
MARGEELNLEDRSPLSKSLLYHLGEMDADAIDDQFDGIRIHLTNKDAGFRLAFIMSYVAYEQAVFEGEQKRGYRALAGRGSQPRKSLGMGME